jgi:carbon-monoxide dehydrogenase large subunit
MAFLALLAMALRAEAFAASQSVDSGGMPVTIMGHAVHRSEDPRHLTGEAEYADDLPAVDALYAVFVRSTVAHALLVGVDVDDARTMPGVAGVFASEDLGLTTPSSRRAPALGRPRLAIERVRFVGEPIAVVVAETRAQAVDAAERVIVDYDPLPVVVDPLDALAEGATLLFPDHGSNIAMDGGGGARSDGDDDFFADADVVITARFLNQRLAPVPLEANACLVVPDGEQLTVWASTQSPFGVRRDVARSVGLEEAAVRVIAPAVGGGFGAKGGAYPEVVVCAALARRLARPVRWAETRSENMLAMTHGRAQVQDVELGAKRDGTLTGLRARLVADAGAYGGGFTSFISRMMTSGVYAIPKIDVRPMGVFTNTAPTGAYRGAGRPEAAALVERSMDLLARELDLDPVALRRRNFIPPDRFPYASPTGVTYDSGEYERALDVALQAVDYDGLRREQAARRERGESRCLGIGVSCYVEVSGQGGEYGSVRIEPDGRVTVLTGTSPHGQGHETTWAQIASSTLSVPFEDITVVHSDTTKVPRGVGTFGSRSLQLGGSAVLKAGEAVLDQAKQLAADLLEADPADIVQFDDGRIGVVGTPTSGLTWVELAAAAPSGLEAEVDFEQDGGTFPFGTHVAIVEVDTETGSIDLQRFVAVDDCGTIVNPLLAEGQVHGGLAQGIAQAMFETVVYDADGNPLTTTLLDYYFPSAADLPSFETYWTETPSPRNPLGAKGIGESGTTGSTPAVQNAVIDALAHFGVTHLDMPLSPERVWRAIQAAAPA